MICPDQSYRASVAVPLGISPFEALFGKQMSIGIDLQLLQESENAPSTSTHVTNLVSRLKLIHEIVQQNMSESGQRAKKFYDVDTETPKSRSDQKFYYTPTYWNQTKVQNFINPGPAPTLLPLKPMMVFCTLYGIAIQANHYVRQCTQIGSNCTIQTETCFITVTTLNPTMFRIRFHQIRRRRQ